MSVMTLAIKSLPFRVFFSCAAFFSGVAYAFAEGYPAYSSGGAAGVSELPAAVPESSVHAEFSGGSVELCFYVGAGAYVSPDAVRVEGIGEDGAAVEMHPEPGTEKTEKYRGRFSLRYPLPDGASRVKVVWSMCLGDVCLVPETKEFAVSGDAAASPGSVSVAGTPAEWPEAVRSSFAYMDAGEFAGFLSGEEQQGNPLVRIFGTWGYFALALVVFFCGAALNLTPCVLPMVPVNIAIMGLGASGVVSRAGAWLTGCCFGAGIMAAWGTLGVLASAGILAFGGLRSFVFFNYAVALLFFVLGLACFDVIRVDFSSLGRRLGTAGRRRDSGRAARFSLAFGLGAASAVMSGACVAPVLVWTLVLAATLSHEGRPVAGAILPFILGAGMGAPWPFVASGIARFPKPGMWMNRVKAVFGILFMLFAVRYAAEALPWGGPRGGDGEQWFTDAAAAFAESGSSGKPILLYFTAQWCTVCRDMERTTFSDSEVASAMERFVPLKIDCTDTSSQPAASLMQKYGVSGFPFFAVLDKVNAAYGAAENTDTRGSGDVFSAEGVEK